MTHRFVICHKGIPIYALCPFASAEEAAIAIPGRAQAQNINSAEYSVAELVPLVKRLVVEWVREESK